MIASAVVRLPSKCIKFASVTEATCLTDMHETVYIKNLNMIVFHFTAWGTEIVSENTYHCSTVEEEKRCHKHFCRRQSFQTFSFIYFLCLLSSFFRSFPASLQNKLYLTLTLHKYAASFAGYRFCLPGPPVPSVPLFLWKQHHRHHHHVLCRRQ